jgi:hypothetical protein
MLILQIQALPGFDTFLKRPSFDTLHSAARHGLITTSDDFYARANELQGQLLGARKEGPVSNTYEDALCFVLKELYEPSAGQ